MSKRRRSFSSEANYTDNNRADKPPPAPSSFSSPEIGCNLWPCNGDQRLQFHNEQEYELHYLTYHSNICQTCHKNFPSDHILSLHIDETHSALTQIKLEKGEPALHCFVSDCDRLFTTHKKRRMHLVDKHDYPKDFLFSVVDCGIKPGQASLLKRNTDVRSKS